MEFALDGLILATAWLHTSLAPYTKVEESFNLHAIHDVLMYGVGPQSLGKYDHFVFPGSVPRTFVGSILVAWVASPILQVTSTVVRNKFDLQILARIILATLNTMGLCLIRRAVSNHFGSMMGVYYTILTCSQFHLPFWISRTIPNMFAFFLVNLSTYVLLNRPPNFKNPKANRVSTAVSILTGAAAIFRGEIALYLAPLCLQALASRSISFGHLLRTGIISGVLSAALTVSVDSYFWDQEFLWPEISGLFFNIVEGKSAEWGVSPPFTYFTSFLPKLLLSSLPLSLVGMAHNRQIRNLTFPSWGFLALISFLGHKEWRFITYVVPIFNIAAARGLYALYSPSKRSWRGRVGFLIASSLIVSNMLFTAFSTAVSVTNYPGGEAMRQLHAIYDPLTNKSPVHVHISNLAAQTGASLFTQLHSQPAWPRASQDVNWIYNKTELLTIDDLTASDSPFTHLILESKPPSTLLKNRGWSIVSTINAFEGVQLFPASGRQALRQVVKNPSLPSILRALNAVIVIRKADKLWIAERSEDREA